MSNHYFRNARLCGLDPMREWIRRHCPSSADGFVVSDIDLAVRTYGGRSDGWGTLMFVEKKENGATITGGEGMIFRWMDILAANSTWAEGRWGGCHLLSVRAKESWPECPECGQAIRTDPDLADRIFASSELLWDGKLITHDELVVRLSNLGKADAEAAA